MNRLFLATLAAFAVLLAVLSPPATAAPAADYVFTKGKVYTMDAARPWAEAVAVKDGRIVFVGSSADVVAYVAPATHQVDLAGRMLMPGFIDGHNHILSGTAGKRGVNLVGSRNKEEMLGRIRRYVAANPDKKRYLGFGWMFTTFGDSEGTRADLDAICPDKPILLFNEDNHHAWFNTACMKRVGLDRKTPDPIPGGSWYSREADGTPRGLAYEPNAWMSMALTGHFFGGREMLEEIGAEVIPTIPRFGITTFHDMGIWAPGLTDGWKGFEYALSLEKAGRLPFRLFGTYPFRDAAEAPDKHIATLKEWKRRYRSALVGVTGLKIWADGTFLSHTSVQIEPFADRPGSRGDSGWTVDRLYCYFAAAHQAGFPVYIHVDGDGAARRCLDAFERLAKEHPAQRFRDALQHATQVHPDDVARIRTLGIGVNGTPVWLVDYKGQFQEAVRILGQSRVNLEFGIFREFIEKGINVSFGSDLPGVDPWEIAPLFQIQAVVTGRVPGSDTKFIPPANRLPTLEQMLRAYTMGGAWQLSMEKELGSIEKGKKADLIVLDHNLFDISPDRIAETKVVMTMVGGRVVGDGGLRPQERRLPHD